MDNFSNAKSLILVFQSIFDINEFLFSLNDIIELKFYCL